MGTAGVAVAIVTAGAGLALAWRGASRRWSLPCPSLLAWTLDNALIRRSPLTTTTLARIGARPGERVLEVGPGPGRLLIPLARSVRPDGAVVGVDIQPAMVERLRRNAARAGVANLSAIVGDATRPHFAADTFDVAVLCTTLGEIPAREAVLAECRRALRPGGRLSITEVVPDPHYQSRATVRRLAEAASFRPVGVAGGWPFYTATFVKA